MPFVDFDYVDWALMLAKNMYEHGHEADLLADLR